MTIWVVAGALLYLLILWIVLGMVRIAAKADRQMTLAFENMMQQRKEANDDAEKQPALYQGGNG